jgi:hypothetical protein
LTKAAFGRGRGDLCLSQALIDDHWDKAEADFKKVLDDFEGAQDRDKDRLRDLAAQAHANLGLVYLPAVGDPDAEAKYRSAAKQYDEAVKWTRHPDAQAVYYRMLSHIHGRLHEYPLADAAHAAALDPHKRTEYEAMRQEQARSPGSASLSAAEGR